MKLINIINNKMNFTVKMNQKIMIMMMMMMNKKMEMKIKMFFKNLVIKKDNFLFMNKNMIIKKFLDIKTHIMENK